MEAHILLPIINTNNADLVSGVVSFNPITSTFTVKLTNEEVIQIHESSKNLNKYNYLFMLSDIGKFKQWTKIYTDVHKLEDCPTNRLFYSPFKPKLKVKGYVKDNTFLITEREEPVKPKLNFE